MIVVVLSEWSKFCENVLEKSRHCIGRNSLLHCGERHH